MMLTAEEINKSLEHMSLMSICREAGIDYQTARIVIYDMHTGPKYKVIKQLSDYLIKLKDIKVGEI